MKRITTVASFVVVLAACAGAGGVSPPAEAAVAPSESSRTSSTTTVTSGACSRSKPGSCQGAAPSYAKDVKPILEQRCLSCHAGDGVAADEHDFSKLATLLEQKNSVMSEVSKCAMPPKSAPALEAKEADTLMRWIACGAPQN